jgi:hypothetical protein
MKRHLLHVVLFALIAIVAANSAVVGQDKVERRDRKSDKATTVNGKIIDESVAGVKVKAGAKEEMIASSEIVRVFYDDVPATAKLAYVNLFINEEKEKDQSKVLKEYKDFAPKIAAAPNVALKRYVDYRIAMLEAATADSDMTKEEARKSLDKFVGAHATSWEYPFAARMLARLQMEKPDFEAAQKTLEGLAKNAQAPNDIRQEADIMLVDVLFQQPSKIDEVKAKIASALNSPMTSEAQKARFTVYQIGIEAQAADAKVEDVVKKLEEAIAKSSDNSLKALAYNVMGDCYLAKQRKRDAMWSYLWVDVVYSQDKGEHLKAMTKLLKIFEDDKDNEKAQLYKDKIARSRS